MGNETQHTPGPWGTSPCSTETQYRVEVHAEGVPVALLSCASDDTEAIPVVAADALLIAAAPDLLAVAKEIEALSPNMEHADDCAFVQDNIVAAHKEGRPVASCDCWLTRLRKAIAKAEGRS
jgi:hypothetical protein